MARALVVERDTNELRIVLQRGCQPATAESVTLTITRAGLTCREPPPPCDAACRPVCPPPLVMECYPSKVYFASRVEPGFAIFSLDQDIMEAPEGWYRAMIEVDGCEVAILPLLVQCSGVTVNSYRVTCAGLFLAE
jgi:hypothetical protein